MPDYLYSPARERELRIPFTLSGTHAEQSQGGPPATSPVQRASATLSAASPWGGSAEIERIWIPSAHAGTAASVASGLGDTDSDTAEQDITDPWFNWERVLSAEGEFLITVAETVVSVTTLGTWGHTSGEADPPYETRIEVYERAKIGATVSTTMEVDYTDNFGANGTISLSASDTVAAPFTVGYPVTLTVEGGAENRGNTLTATADFLETTVSYPGYSETDTAPGGGVATATGGAGATLTLSSPGVAQSASGTFSVTRAPDRTFALSGIVRAMRVAHPGALEAIVIRHAEEPAGHIVSISGGAFSSSYTQRQYSAGATLNGNSYPADTLDEWGPVSCKFRISSLQGYYGNDNPVAQDDRLPMRAFRWSGASIAQAASVSLLTGGASATWDPSPDKALGSYAYLDVGIATDNASEAGELTLTSPQGAKSWPTVSHATPGATATVRIDLCSPDEIDGAAPTADTDATDSRYPEDGAAGADGYNNPGGIDEAGRPYWGFERLESATLTGGANPRIVSATLVRATRSRFTLLQSLRWWPQEKPRSIVAENDPGEEDDTYTDFFTSRFAQGETDGKLSLDEAALKKQITHGGVSGIDTTTWHPRTLAELCARISSATFNPGWTATDLDVDPGNPAPTPPALYDLAADFLNGSREAACWGGAGLLCDNGTWRDYWDKDVSSALSIPAQVLFDRFEGWPPECGDVLGLVDSAAAGDTPLRAGQILDGSAHGLVLEDADGARKAGVTVALTETSGGAARGTGATDSAGFYETGTPYGKAGTGHTAEAQTTSPFPSVAFADFDARKRHRASFRAAGEASGISYDVSDSLRHVRAFVQGGTIWIGFARTVIPNTWEDADTGIAGTKPFVRFDRYEKGQPLYLLYTSAGSVLRRKTVNEGVNWSVPTTIATGTNGSLYVDKDGVFHYAYTNGATLRYQARDRHDNAVAAETTAVAAGVADDSTGIAAYPGQGGKSLVTILYQGGGSILTTTTENRGQTWS